MKYQSIKKQSGAVLAISLALLAAITLLAAMNMQRAGLQTRIIANTIHKDAKFLGNLNEQDFWYLYLKTADLGDPILSAPIREYTVNEGGGRDYQPVELNMMNTISDYPVQVDNRLILLPAEPGINALAQGQEVGSRIKLRYRLWTRADLVNRAPGQASEYQVSGLSFPALNSSKNSLYSAP
jgi:hypothetical protein